MFAIAVYEVVIMGYSILFSCGFFLAGIAFGFAVSRMFHLSWDENQQAVTSRIDRI